MHTGYPNDKELKSHHVTIIPAKPLDYKPMNAKENHDSQNTTQGGYAGSDMVKADTSDQTGLGQDGSTLETIYENYIKEDFTLSGVEHILTYRNLLTNAMDDKRTNRFGTQNGGASSSWDWYPRKLDLMSEMNVYGGIVASSSIWDTGIDNRQYALFRLKPELINSYNGQQFHYWLKDVATSTYFANVDGRGYSHAALAAHNLLGVRPRFLIG